MGFGIAHPLHLKDGLESGTAKLAADKETMVNVDAPKKDQTGDEGLSQLLDSRPPVTVTMTNEQGTFTVTYSVEPTSSASSTIGVVEPVRSLGSPQPTPTQSVTRANEATAAPSIDPQSVNNRREALGTGAKAGIAVGAVFVVVLVALAVFFVLRRRKTAGTRHYDESDLSDNMIVSDKQKGFDDHISQPPVIGSTLAPSSSVPTHPYTSTPPPQSLHHYVGDASPVVVPRTSGVVDLENRPVSPVDDLLADGPDAPAPGSSRGLGTSSPAGAVAGGAEDDDDREMAWILEEERKARERREAAGRLPTAR